MFKSTEHQKTYFAQNIEDAFQKKFTIVKWVNLKRALYNV